MLIFTSPDVAKGGFELAIARKAPGTYLLILARAYGMAATRVFAVLNSSTPSSTVAASSADGHPLIWLDTDLDRDPRNLGPPEGVLAALKAADAQVVKPTGRVQRMHAKEGGERDAHELELVLSEDQLARCCWYCDALETDVDVRDNDRFRSCGGEGYASTYMCHQVWASRSLTHCRVPSDLRSTPVCKQIWLREGRIWRLALVHMNVCHYSSLTNPPSCLFILIDLHTTCILRIWSMWYYRMYTYEPRLQSHVCTS